MPARFVAFLVLLALPLAAHSQTYVVQPSQTPRQPDKKITVTYAVADLVVPIRGLDIAVDAERGEEKKTKEDWLIDKITHTVAPATWSEVGGAGTIHYYPLSMALVVCQSARVQDQVRDLLETMRRVQNVEVSAETRLLASGDGLFFTILKRWPTLARGGHMVLTSSDTKALLDLAQQDAGTTLMQAPKVTLYSGQRVQLKADNLDVRLSAMVAANLHHVDVNVKAQTGTVEFARTQRLTEGSTLAQLARADDGSYLIFLLRPRVLINQEEAAVFTKEPAPAATVVQAAGVQSAPAPQPVPAPAATPQPNPLSKLDPRVARILQKYDDACAAGEQAKAMRLAQRALAIDPTCFKR